MELRIGILISSAFKKKCFVNFSYKNLNNHQVTTLRSYLMII